jgi:enoyl-[acyl-carrier-protein] reductase (NADH)
VTSTEETSGIVLFLASEMSGSATAAVFTVDAGQTVH